jgi:enoyl-CoA hydratase/carnithine racemase
MTDTVLIEKAERVLTITLNRPEKKNAFTPEMYRAIQEAVDGANEDREVRAILVQANGDMFTAGNDVGRFAAINAGEVQVQGRPAGEPMLLAFANAKKPLVAAVHGRAIGVGFTMLLHFDLVYVAEEALLSCPFVNLALSPEGASSLLLPSRVGHARAFQLFALGEAIDGRTAAAWGIANAALPSQEVRPKARAAALALAARPPASVALTKALMRDPAPFDERIRHEFDLFYERLASPEAREALAAFFEKRPPDFSRF